MRLVLAEDHALLRAGLTQLLEHSGFTILHAVDNAPDLALALRDPEADTAFLTELRAWLSDPQRVVEVEANLYSNTFADACSRAFLEVWGTHRSAGGTDSRG